MSVRLPVRPSVRLSVRILGNDQNAKPSKISQANMPTSQHRLHYFSNCNLMDNRYPFLSVIVLSIAFLLKIDFVVMNYHTAFHRFVFVHPYFIFPCHSLSITPSFLLRFYIPSFLSTFSFFFLSLQSFLPAQPATHHCRFPTYFPTFSSL